MKKKKVLRLIRGVLLLCIIVCLVQLCRTYYLSFRHRQKQAAMGERRWENMQGAADDAADGGTPRGEAAGEAADVPPQPRILAGLGGLYEENHDLVGWLSIEGMKIDYPVMQCGDNDYYLNHDFYGEEDKYGCLFVKDIADVNTPADNFVIYGHNMKDGSMFGDLDLYKKEAFYREHATIRFDTLYEERTYEIVAVFLSRVYDAEEEGFRYYDFYEAETQEEFIYFYENIKSAALYETGVTAEYGDTFLTLSTCAYHEEDGRFVVVAKRVD
ncbi:MAG: class B sortase [Lachnospiraceae bacterium]|nr:class B sortase [Lachnospiraceae bacterium]